MTTMTKFLRRTSVLTCVASIVSSAAFADSVTDAMTLSSAIDEYTLELNTAPQGVVGEQVAPSFVAPAPEYTAPEVTTYNAQPETDIYIESAPAPDQYLAPVEAEPEALYTVIETNPAPYTAQPTAIPEPVVLSDTIVVSEPVTLAPAQPVQALAPPPPPPPTVAPPVAAAGGGAVAAPVAPVGGLGASGLGGAGLIAAGVGAAALIAIAAVALSDDDDDPVAGGTGTGTQ